MHALVSLIVVTYNSADLLPTFWAALAHTTYPCYETIVVDNASSDATAQVAHEFAADRVIANDQNVGFGRACNIGATVAQGEYLIFLNPDVQVTPDWLDLLVAHSRTHPQVGIVCPQTLYPGTPWHPPVQPLQFTAAVPGSALTITRAAWQAIGGFDPAMFLYWEDTELCWRAWLLGWAVAEDLHAVVYHERGASAGSSRWDAERTKNSLYTYLKLMRWRRVGPFALGLAAKTAVKLMIYRDISLLHAWWWNVRHLPQTLRARRRIQRMRVGEYAALERLIDQHTRRQRRERRMRSRNV